MADISDVYNDASDNKDELLRRTSRWIDLSQNGSNNSNGIKSITEETADKVKLSDTLR